jgi:hypothetical protein
MTDDATQQTLRQLFDSGRELVYEFTGAGSLALAWLHSVGGSSRLLLEASDRYSTDSLGELIGFDPAKHVSAETAAAMSLRAYRRAVRLSAGSSPCVGLACTATIATERTKRGEHACHVAVHDRSGRTDYSLVMTKGERDRFAEETLVARLVLHALAVACEVKAPALNLFPGEQLVRAHSAFADPVHLLLDRRASSVTVQTGGHMNADEPFNGILLSGSFNPLHCGHETMLRVAGKYLNQPTAYELPIVNADKPMLAPNEIERRHAQFKRAPVILTREPLFRQKARLFPGCTFLMGYDTAVRLVDARYYAGESGRDAALADMRGHGCKLLVAARPIPGEGIHTLADVAVPRGFEGMFLELPRSEFLLDLSSTELRSGG